MFKVTIHQPEQGQKAIKAAKDIIAAEAALESEQKAGATAKRIVELKAAVEEVKVAFDQLLSFETEDRAVARAAALVGKAASIQVDVTVEVAPRPVKFKNI